MVFLPLFVLIERKAAQPILPMTMLAKGQPSLILFGFFLLTASNFSRVSNSDQKRLHGG